MVFYRKYRPQKIEDLDSESVRDSLNAIFAISRTHAGNKTTAKAHPIAGKDTFPHAFLFTGPKGLGKTSAARIVAKVINCTNRRSNEPCDKCDQCLSIIEGNNLDVLEIDGASNRGIDEIRDLREKIKLVPFKASKKIYIIDEVHMLTTEAFNALLKTLEEPPSHAVFILCTTEFHKLPATIASRCFRINFSRATEAELIRSLNRIVKAEKIKTDKDSLTEIARLSDGSFRDGAKILEEIVTFAGRKTITRELVSEKFKTLGVGESIDSMLNALSVKDAQKGIKICHELVKQGMDMKFFIEELINQLHKFLLEEIGVEKKQERAYSFTIDEIQRLFGLLSEAYNQTKIAVLEQMPLELIVLEWANDNNGLDLSSGPKASDETPGNPSNRNVSTVVKKQSLTSEDNFLKELINEVKSRNPLVAGLLRSCSAGEVKNGKIDIIATSNFHKEKLEEPKAKKLLEDSVDKILGKEIKVNIILKSRGGERL